MADELDKLFSKIQMGTELLSPSELAELSNAFFASKTQALFALLTVWGSCRCCYLLDL